jgi:hypothetical protein
VDKDDAMADEADAALDQDRYKTAREGDHFMICFQCDDVSVQELERNETRLEPKKTLFHEVHQASDFGFILVSRAVDGGHKYSRINKNRPGGGDTYGIPQGPFPVDDMWEYAPRASREAWPYTTPHVLGSAALLAGEKKKTQRFTTSPTYRILFRKMG